MNLKPEPIRTRKLKYNMRSSIIAKRRPLKEKTISSRIYEYLDSLSWSNLIAISFVLLSVITVTYIWKVSDISKSNNGITINTSFLTFYRNKLKTKLQTFFLIIGTTFFIGLFLLLIRCSYSYIQNRKSENLSFLDELIKKIKGELYALHTASKNDPTDPKSSIDINELHSRIFATQDHRITESVWNNAMTYLELNDKEVQFGLMIKNGKECETIKWNANIVDEELSGSPPPNKTIDNNCENQLNCLKIRQMFDSSDTENPFLEKMIKDAIFEKLSNCCEVHDIQLDVENLCAYVRCATEMDATIAYNKLNGWYFNKHLVSIKYLRLQRYKIRFPNTSVGSKEFFASSYKS